LLNKSLNKKIKPSKGTRGKEKKDISPNKRPYLKVRHAQWGALRGENMKLRT
jgi:hypothetical protein